MISIHRYLRSFCRGILLCWKTWYWTVVDLDIVSVEILKEFVYFLKKCLYSSKKNLLPIPAATLQLYGGLNHIILRPLQYRFSFYALQQILYAGIWYFVYNHCSIEIECCYKDLLLLNDTLFINFDLLSGRFLILVMFGGWL